VKAENEELEEEEDNEDEYNEAREAEGPAEYAQKWQAREIGAKVEYQHEEKKTQKEEKKTHKEGANTKDDRFEKVEVEHVTKEPASEVDEEVIDLEAHSNAVQ